MAFNQAFEKNKNYWTKDQYPEEWFSKMMNQTLQKIISRGKDQLRTTPKEHQKSKTRSHFSTIQSLPYSKLCKQIEETMRIASGFYNTEIKIKPPHHEMIFRKRPEIPRCI